MVALMSSWYVMLFALLGNATVVLAGLHSRKATTQFSGELMFIVVVVARKKLSAIITFSIDHRA